MDQSPPAQTQWKILGLTSRGVKVTRRPLMIPALILLLVLLFTRRLVIPVRSLFLIMMLLGPPLLLNIATVVEKMGALSGWKQPT